MLRKQANVGNSSARSAEPESGRHTKRRKFRRRPPRNQIPTHLTPDTSMFNQQTTVNQQTHQSANVNGASTGDVTDPSLQNAQPATNCTDVVLFTAPDCSSNNLDQVAQQPSRNSVHSQNELPPTHVTVTEPEPEPEPDSVLAQTSDHGDDSDSSCIEIIPPKPAVSHESPRQLALVPYSSGSSLKRPALESPRWNASNLKRLRLEDDDGLEKDDTSATIQAPKLGDSGLPHIIPNLSPHATPICASPTLINDTMRSLQSGQTINAFAFNLVLNVLNPDPVRNILFQYHQLNGPGSRYLTPSDLINIDWSRLFMVFHHRTPAGANNWTLGVIDREHAQYMVYDPSASQSFRDQSIKELRSFVQTLTSTMPNTSEEWHLQALNPRFPSQTNAVDSGIFIMMVVMAIFYEWSTIQCLDTGLWRSFFAALISPAAGPPQTARELLLALPLGRPTITFSNTPRTPFRLTIQHSMLESIAGLTRSAEEIRDQLLTPIRRILAAVEENLQKTARAMRDVEQTRKEIASIEFKLQIFQPGARELRASLERQLAVALKVRAQHSHYRHWAGHLAARHRGKAYLEAVIADLVLKEDRMKRDARELTSQAREALIGALRWLDSHASD